MHNDIFNNYTPNDKSSLIPLLQDVQSTYSYLPEPALRDVAEFLGIPLSNIYLPYEKIFLLNKQSPIIKRGPYGKNSNNRRRSRHP